MTKLIILLLVALLMVTIIYGNINIIENLLETEDINDDEDYYYKKMKAAVDFL